MTSTNRIVFALAATYLLAAACKHSSAPSAPAGSPTAPADLQGILTPSRSTQLTWTDNSDDETGFRVEQNLDGDWEVRTEVDADVTEYEALGNRSDSTYHWRVRAFNDNGASNPSNEITLVTPAASTPTGCGLVLGECLQPTSGDSGTDSGELWAWAMHSGIEQVVAHAPFTPGSEAELDGGANGTTWVVVTRRDFGRTLELELQLRFSEVEIVENGHVAEMCLMLHDLAQGDYETHGLRAESRVACHARLPLPGVMPVIPRRDYWMTVTVHRLERVFDVRLGDLLLAEDISIDSVLVVPSVYLEL